MNVFRRKSVLLAAAVLMLSSSAAWAVCRPNNCAAQFSQCVANGGDEGACEIAYYRCLRNYGCPIP